MGRVQWWLNITISVLVLTLDSADGEVFTVTNLKGAPGSAKRKTRKGRGIAAGQGATCGFGMRGQSSRSGRPERPGFEGGQTPLYRRLPKMVGKPMGPGHTREVFNLITLEQVKQGWPICLVCCVFPSAFLYLSPVLFDCCPTDFVFHSPSFSAQRCCRGKCGDAHVAARSEARDQDKAQSDQGGGHRRADDQRPHGSGAFASTQYSPSQSALSIRHDIRFVAAHHL